MAGLEIGRFGDAAVAGHQVAVSVASVTYMMPMGLAMATTVRVGDAVGRGDAAGVRRAGLAGILLTLATQALSCTLMLALPGPIASIYSADPAVIAGAVVLLQFAAAFQFSDGIQVVSIGALRGLKDARVPMLITGFSYWGVGMPVGWFLAFPQNWRAPGMWVGMIAAWRLRCCSRVSACYRHAARRLLSSGATRATMVSSTVSETKARSAIMPKAERLSRPVMTYSASPPGPVRVSTASSTCGCVMPRISSNPIT
jgi:MATE family multidrug resistance protein